MSQSPQDTRSQPWKIKFHKKRSLFISPGIFALIYAVVGATWVWISDLSVFLLVEHSSTSLVAQLIKGGLYIAVTSTLIYWLANRSLQQVRQQFAIEESNASQNLLQNILSSLGEAVLLIDPANRSIVQCNQAAASLFGYSQKELIGQNSQILHESRQTYEEFGCLSAPILSKHGVFNAEIRMRRKDSSFIEVAVTVTAINEKIGWEGGVISIIHDITARKLAEQELQQSRKQYLNLVERTPDLITRVDKDGRLLFVNHAANKFFGLTERDCIGRLAFDFIHPEDREATKSAFADWLKNEEEVFFHENRLVSTDGNEYFMEWSIRAEHDESGRLTGVAGTARDITEKRLAQKEQAKLEGQLQQVQKLESIGQLAGGIAHDFNNMLSVILGHAELAIRRSDPSHPATLSLNEIRKAANRSADLTRQLLTFARKQTINPKILNLNELVTGMFKMLQRLIGENIHIIWIPAPNLWSVKIDPSQFDQILTNLCINARDSLSGAGEITIHTENCILDESDKDSHPEIVTGDYVLLMVRDNGSGMSKEVLGHIFEPFFTTKEVGVGTGLGLATVLGAIKQHGGYVYALSEPGQGTTFNIYLPRELGMVDESSNEKEHPIRQGSETILLVEDDPRLLQLLKSMLTDIGYKVLPALTGDLALSLTQDHSGSIELLLSDLIMPGINGKELSEKLLMIRPEMKVLYMSGYSHDIISSQGFVHNGIHLLQKPISLENLANTVRDMLDNPK